MSTKKAVIILLVFLSGFFYYQMTGNIVDDRITVKVLKVVDGDTVEIESGQRIRFLGINTPEKSRPYYDEAKKFLALKVENKFIQIESYGKDKYGRILAHVFFEGEHLNKAILKEGLATIYYYEKDAYYSSMKDAEEFARVRKLFLWEESPNKECLELLELKYIEDTVRCSNEEVLRIKNSCEPFKVIIKDDATHIYEENLSTGIFSKNFSCIWNDAGDTLYVSDQQGLLIFYRYE